MIQGRVLVGDFQGRAGAVDAGDLRAVRGEMEREAALVTEDVESLAVGIVGGGGVVFTLVEKGSGFLAFEGVVAKLDSVHGEGGGSLLALQEAGGARRETFELADAGVDAFDDGRGMKAGGEFGEDRLADGIGVHGLGEDLERENVVVAVDDEAGKEIGFAEDKTKSVGVVDERFAVGEGG